jgi:Domain of unknown function (DUF4332)
MSTVQQTRGRPNQPCNWAIGELPGLSQQHRDQLIEQGIQTTHQLLIQTKTPVLKQALATQLQIHIQYVNKWVALANLACIPAVGCQHCGLLLHAGISSPQQVAQMSLQKVHQQILKLQVATLQREDLCPSIEQVSLWVQQARSLVAQHK